MRRSLGQLQIWHRTTPKGLTVCESSATFTRYIYPSPNPTDLGAFCRRCLKSFDQRGEKKAQTLSKQKRYPMEKGRDNSDEIGFPKMPLLTNRVRECIPLAAQRYRERPPPDEWTTMEPRNPKNRIVTLENGERRIVSKGGALLPLYRDWEKEFGKPIGDKRPYYRKHMGPLLMPYHKNPRLETIQSLIVVEGIADWNAVKAAVNAHVFVCDGASILSHVYEKYTKRTVAQYEGDVILFMDPDTAGRRMRTTVRSLMEPCKHAFVSEFNCIVGMGTINESTGIQYAQPEIVRNALKHTRTYTKDVEDIMFDDLYELGLVQTPAERIEGVRLRRRFTCGFLGIGFCDGRQLLKQVNGYGFSREEIQSAVDKADILVEEWKQNPWRLQKDYTKAPPRKKDTYVITDTFTSAF